LKRGRFQDFGKEPLLARDILLATYLNDQMTELRKAVENHRQKNFSDETGATHQQQRAIAELTELRKLPRCHEVRALHRIRIPPEQGSTATMFGISSKRLCSPQEWRERRRRFTKFKYRPVIFASQSGEDGALDWLRRDFPQPTAWAHLQKLSENAHDCDKSIFSI
jgi:hypothetical protein